MPAAGSGTQAPAYQTWRLLAEVVHLHLGDEEASRERFVYEQKEASNACRQQEQQRLELEQIAGCLRNELTMQAEQHLNHYVQQEQAYFTSRLRSVEPHLQAEAANTRFASNKNTWQELQRSGLEQQHQRMLMLNCIENPWSNKLKLFLNSKNIKHISWREDFNSKENIMSMLVNSGESCKRLNTGGCWTRSQEQPQVLQKLKLRWMIGVFGVIKNTEVTGSEGACGALAKDCVVFSNVFAHGVLLHMNHANTIRMRKWLPSCIARHMAIPLLSLLPVTHVGIASGKRSPACCVPMLVPRQNLSRGGGQLCVAWFASTQGFRSGVVLGLRRS